VTYIVKVALAFSLAVCCAPLMAQQQVDPEWPCIQVFVPELAAGIFWPEVISDEQIGAWKKDKTIAPLAQQLGDLPEFTDKERAAIAEFAEAQAESERRQQLNLLADGVLSVANRTRKLFIRGIKRYTRQQISIAEQIETTLNELAKSDGKASANRAEIEETLAWHQRVYDQRERAIQSLCDQPVELEQTLSEVMRDMAQHIP